VGGHKKAEKQVISSLCSFFPEYAIIVLSAIHPHTGSEPMQLATAFNLPVIIVITHIDLASEQMVREVISYTKNILKELCPEKVPTVITDLESSILMSVIH
jgi:GTPase